jgi:hypothetical protein
MHFLTLVFLVVSKGLGEYGFVGLAAVVSTHLDHPCNACTSIFSSFQRPWGIWSCGPRRGCFDSCGPPVHFLTLVFLIVSKGLGEYGVVGLAEVVSTHLDHPCSACNRIFSSFQKPWGIWSCWPRRGGFDSCGLPAHF